MKQYEGIRPKYVREWLDEKKLKWKTMIDDRIEHARRMGLIPEETKVEVRLSTKDRLKQMGINVGFNEDISLTDSIGDNISTGMEDFDAENL